MLAAVRRRWCGRASGQIQDCPGRTIHLDGAWITDVPSFYLSLGEAINGPGGYFGACLDSLSDCLCGGFGVLSPLTIRLRRFDQVQSALDARAWCRLRAERLQEVKGESTETLVDWGYFGDGRPADVARWTAIYEAALAGRPFECDGITSYFDAILDVMECRGANLIPDNPDSEEARSSSQ
jgi:RNAse (barnase) inhibitor barstar